MKSSNLFDPERTIVCSGMVLDFGLVDEEYINSANMDLLATHGTKIKLDRDKLEPIISKIIEIWTYAYVDLRGSQLEMFTNDILDKIEENL
jgi:hypothetical protein